MGSHIGTGFDGDEFFIETESRTPLLHEAAVGNLGSQENSACYRARGYGGHEGSPRFGQSAFLAPSKAELPAFRPISAARRRRGAKSFF